MLHTKKTLPFFLLSIICLGMVIAVLTKIIAMISSADVGAFFVLFVLCLFFLSLCGYLLFYAFGQKIILFQTIFEHSNDAISICDENGKYIWQNKSHEVLFGFNIDELKLSASSFFINSKEIPLKEELDRIKEFSGIFKSKSQQGYKDVFISAYKVENELNDTICYVQMKREAKEYLRIIEKSQQERERILALSRRDGLTGLLNRNAFIEAVEHKIAIGNNGAIIFADIDNFKYINDTYGHDRGDKVLVGISRLLHNAIRTNDLVARFGGEEFVIWLDATFYDCLSIAEKICRAIDEAEIENLHVTCSIGVSPIKQQDLVSAIKRADEAMYEAKTSGKNQVKSKET